MSKRYLGMKVHDRNKLLTRASKVKHHHPKKRKVNYYLLLTRLQELKVQCEKRKRPEEGDGKEKSKLFRT